MGMLTRPKLILPFQIARITYKLRGCWTNRACDLGRGFEFFAANAAQLVKPDQRFFDQIIRAGGAGGNPDNDLSCRQPVPRDDFFALVQIVMKNLFVRDETSCVADKISRQFFFAHLSEMRSVRAVVAADEDRKSVV